MKLSNFLETVGALTVLIGLTALSGCDDSTTSVLQLSGHYDGTVTLAVHSNDPAVKPYLRVDVGTDINIDGKTQTDILLKDGKGTIPLTLSLSDFSDNSVTLQTSTGMPQPMKLTIDPTSQCYTGENDPFKVVLCTANLEISLEVQNLKTGTDELSAIVYRSDSGVGNHVEETPVSFTLSDAITRARNKSFASRIEFEHVIQAKLNSKASYLHLAPQISLGSIAANLPTAGWATLLGAIGDVAPFLLPDHWYHADAANHQSMAEQDTQILMRLDMGVQVEGLFFAYQRDKNSRDSTQKMLDKLTTPKIGIRDQIAGREADGVLPRSSTPPIDLLIQQLQNNMITLNQIVAEDLANISQTLGYANPGTVTDVSVPALANLDKIPATLDQNTMTDLAIKRSFERQQMDDLIIAANDNREADRWSFLDPYGDPNMFLGFALPSQLDIAQSQIKELTIDKENIESIIRSKVSNAVTDYAASVATYKKAKQMMDTEEDILTDAMGDLQDGITVDFVGLSYILQQYLTNQIGVETAIASYGVSQAEVNRLLLQGNYAGF
jgi:hypothetical protein